MCDNSQVRAYYFGSADDKFVKYIEEFQEHIAGQEKVLNTYEYFRPNIFPKPIRFNKHDVPMGFKTTPDSLLRLASRLVDKMPLPDVFKWTIEDICRWLRQYGYPEYQNTFRVNLVNGRTFLLIDASALSEMNIKNFHHIKHLTYGIRGLFYFQMTKFGRSITLAPDFHYELYKLLRVKNGTKYDTTLRGALWRKMQLVRDLTKRDFREHWDILESWLKLEPDPRSFDRIGGMRRYELYKCKAAKKKVEIDESEHKLEHKDCVPCQCAPPCECFWTEKELKSPWELNILPKPSTRTFMKELKVLSCLHNLFPERYRPPTVRTLRRFQSQQRPTPQSKSTSN